MSEKTDFISDFKKGFEHTKIPAKLPDYFLRSTANPTWGGIFECFFSRFKARKSNLPCFSDKRHSSFKFWVLKELSKMPPHVELAVTKATSIKYVEGTGWCGGVLSWLFLFFITLVLYILLLGFSGELAVALCTLHASFAIPHPSFHLMANAFFTL